MNEYDVLPVVPERPIYVVDASVVLKWFTQLDEGDIDKANLLREKFRNREVELLAPELLIYEVTNVLRYKLDLDISDINSAVESIFEMRLLKSIGQETMKKAVKIARDFDVTVYDATYLSFAESIHSLLITVDERFYEKVHHRPDVILLKDFV